MKITVNKFGGDAPCDIESFTDFHGLEMKVCERGQPVSPGARFWASFAHSDVSELIDSYGNGSSLEDAIANYATAIAGKRLKITPLDGSKPRYIDVPNDLYYGKGTR